MPGRARRPRSANGPGAPNSENQPAETRPGKGKGNPVWWVAGVSAGRVVVEVEGIKEHFPRKALALAATNISVRPMFMNHDAR